MITEAIILAGGQGKRMRSVTNNVIPKCLVKVVGKPILHHIIDNLLGVGITRFIINISHLAEKIVVSLENRYPDVSIIYNSEPRVLGTGGSIKSSVHLCTTTDVLVMYSDIMYEFDEDFLEFITLHENNNLSITMLAVPLKSRYGVITMGHDRWELKEKPIIDQHYINAGIFILDVKALLPLLPRVGSLESTVFENTPFNIHIETMKKWISVETVKELEKANEMFRES